MPKDPVETYRQELREDLEFRLDLENRLTNLEVKVWIIIGGLGVVCTATIILIVNYLALGKKGG